MSANTLSPVRRPVASELAAIFDASPNCYLVLNPDLTVAYINAAHLASVGRRAEEVVGRPLFDAFPVDADDEDAVQLKRSLERTRETQRASDIAVLRYPVPPPGGPDGAGERYWSVTHTPIVDDDGQLRFILQHAQDVTMFGKAQQRAPGTESLRAEASVLRRAAAVQHANHALSQQCARLLNLFRQAPGFIAVLEGPSLLLRMANAALETLIGKRRYLDRPLHEALPELASQGYLDIARRVYATGEPFRGRGMPVRLRDPGGRLRQHYVDFLIQPMHEDDDPARPIVGIAVSGYDVTTHWETRRDLGRHRDRLEDLVRERTAEIEEMARQRRDADAARNTSMRLEAIGKLTGGIAHDFNNVLQIIRSSLQLLEDRVADDPTADRHLALAQEGVGRGARLASQLLAFARRQQLDPIVLNLRDRLGQLTGLLGSALGPGIEIATIAAPDLWNIRIDPDGLENVLLNLAINARDAMGGRGHLTIEADNIQVDERYARSHDGIEQGRYVMLAVSDTGCGMNEEVRRRALEPFFTTKPAGEGSGLGLSMAHGFMRQSGGTLDLYSEVGVGSTIKLYFPYSADEVTRLEQDTEAPPDEGSETVLVVEDESVVRATAVEFLRGFGYHVLAAADATQALTILRGDTPVDLLFSDVVMPGPVRSDELAAEARRLRPDIAVLFTSGYPEHAIRQSGQLGFPNKLLQKPYRREDLARMVRQVLRRRALTQRAATTSTPPPLRVLLVEDNEILRSTTAEYLRELAYEVTACANGSEALARVADGVFDVLMTDIDLPGMSGLELVHAVRAQQPTIGAVIVSGYVHLLGDNVPPDTHMLAKPFEMAALDRLLREAGRRREASQRREA